MKQQSLQNIINKNTVKTQTTPAQQLFTVKPTMFCGLPGE